MKLVLVHDWLTGLRGGEKCLAVLCRLAPNAPLFTLLYRRDSTIDVIERRPIVTSFLDRLPGVTRYYRYLLPLMPLAVESLRIPHDTDLVVSFSHAVAKSIRVPPGIPHICYCFTPMRYAWHRRADYLGDESTAGPSFFRGPIRALQHRILDRIRQWDRATASRVTHFIAISREIQRRIRECYDRASHIIYPPVDTDFYTPADDDEKRSNNEEPAPRDDYYLYVGALVPYKRADLAVEACRRLGRRLVVIGDGPERARLERLAGPTVTLLGRQDDATIRRHLRRARALIFPADEDFGIVPVEAQACGTAVLALGRGGAAETVIEATPDRPGTGLFFPAQSVDAVAEAIRRLETGRDRIDHRLARRQALRFSTERFERELVSYIEDITGKTFR